MPGVAWVMSTNSLQARTLRRALGVCDGDVDALAVALGVSVGEIAHWLDGHAVPSADVHVRALDMVAGAKRG